MPAVFFRQPEIQQHEVIYLIRQRKFRGGPVLYPVNAKTVLAQTLLDAIAYHGVVFNQQQSHTAFHPSACCGESMAVIEKLFVATLRKRGNRHHPGRKPTGPGLSGT
jgi:hypothetical protein